VRALIAGQGALPGVLARALPDAVICELEGFASGLPDPVVFRIETLGSLIAALRARGVRQVCFAGAVRRPPLDPAAVDAATMPLVPRMMAALQQGDDAALRTVIAFFEEAGLEVVGAAALLPDLLPDPGVLSRAEPGPRDRSDADRAQAIHAALGAADVGQGCVVAGGQALALEAFGGTDWMLATLAGSGRPEGPSGGILFKAPKPGQDRRIDLPAIGPATIAGAQAAGLSGIVIEAGGVMVLERAATLAAADAAGLFLWVREP
jgi:DUF1009 family protein